jgi:CheY-like chemotaxis protein
MNDYDVVDVLIAEDNPQDAEMITRALKKAHFLNAVFWVKDGVQALDFIRCTGEFETRHAGNPIKLLLLDLKMPRLDGLGVLKSLKEDEATRSIPVVAMTSSNQESDIKECYRLGVNGFVTKPVQFTDFTEALGNVGMYWLLVNRVS